MSKRVEVLVLVVLALVCGGAFYYMAETTVVPMVARGAGPGGVQVTGSGWLQLLLSALGAGGFSIASVFTILKNWVALMPKGLGQDAASAAVNASEQVLLAKLYNASKDPIVRKSLRTAAQGYQTSKFNADYPIDPAIDGTA